MRRASLPGRGLLGSLLGAAVLAALAPACQGRLDPGSGPAEAEPDPAPDPDPDKEPDPDPDTDGGLEPDPAPPFVCPPFAPPPGLGGPDDAELTEAAVERWLAFRAAREEERVLEAWRPEEVRARYRIEQSWIDEGCLSLGETVDVGRGLFLRTFTLAEGLGNDLAEVPGTQAGDKPRPNLRRFQAADDERGVFGGPDAVSCVSCHWKGGFAGGGDRADNMFFLGDGEQLSTHDSRNPPALWGAGWTERIAVEMSATLQEARDELVDAAAEEGAPVSGDLVANGVSFGSLTAHPDGTLDHSGLAGVDEDLVIKPFGWKGVFPTLRSFLLASANGHLGLQAEELIAGVADGRIHDVDLGALDDEGQPGADPDEDGVERELTEGQMSALALFLATLDAPRIRIPPEPEFAVRWQEGAALFDQIGCATCHVPLMPVSDPRYRTTGMVTGAVTEVDLAASGARPRPEPDEDGLFWVPVFSDFKRHRMGSHLTGPNAEHGVPGDTWLTRRLWGLANTAPYLHDASAATFDEAIAMHGGEGSEAAFAVDAWGELTESEQGSVRVFLLSLARGPAVRIR